MFRVLIIMSCSTACSVKARLHVDLILCCSDSVVCHVKVNPEGNGSGSSKILEKAKVPPNPKYIYIYISPTSSPQPHSIWLDYHHSIIMWGLGSIGILLNVIGELKGMVALISHLLLLIFMLSLLLCLCLHRTYCPSFFTFIFLLQWTLFI